MKKSKSILKLFLYIVIYLVSQMAVGLIFSFYNSSKGVTPEGLAAMLDKQAFLVNILGAILFLAIMYSLKEIKAIRRAENPIDNKDLWLSSLLVAFSYSLLFLILTADKYFSNDVMIDQSITYYNDFVPGLGKVMMVISVIIMTPWVEEFLCRRAFIGVLRKDYPRPVTILISGVLFGLAHIHAGGWTLALGGILMGTIFAFVYVGSGYNFKLSVVCHGLANCADLIYPVLPKNLLGLIGIILVAVIVVGCVYIYRSYYSKS